MLFDIQNIHKHSRQVRLGLVRTSFLIIFSASSNVSNVMKPYLQEKTLEITNCLVLIKDEEMQIKKCKPFER